MAISLQDVAHTYRAFRVISLYNVMLMGKLI